MNARSLTLRSVNKSYDGKHMAADDVSLDIKAGEFVSFLGPSGSGKTTTLMMIAGFQHPTSGEIRLGERAIDKLPPHKRNIGMVFQNYALFPHMTVGENTAYALEVAGVAKARRREQVAAALKMVGLEGMEGRRPRQLSGGQQQRVALARAIIARPKLLLLDEPLSALDKNLRQAMQIELKTLQHELGISFIFVTHDQQEALTMSDRVAVLSGGRIQQLDTPRAIYDRPVNSFVATFIGASNLFEGRIDGDRLMTSDGTEIRHRRTPSAASGAATALIRPEQFFLADEAEPFPCLHIDLEAIVFVGSTFELFGRTQAGRKIVAEIPAGRRSLIGDIERTRRARLAYDPAAVHLIHPCAEA